MVITSCSFYSTNARCAQDIYNCKGRNPCSPSPCEEGTSIYAGRWKNKYVTCEEEVCEEHNCPDGEVFNAASSECGMLNIKPVLSISHNNIISFK